MGPLRSHIDCVIPRIWSSPGSTYFPYSIISLTIREEPVGEALDIKIEYVLKTNFQIKTAYAIGVKVNSRIFAEFQFGQPGAEPEIHSWQKENSDLTVRVEIGMHHPDYGWYNSIYSIPSAVLAKYYPNRAKYGNYT